MPHEETLSERRSAPQLVSFVKEEAPAQRTLSSLSLCSNAVMAVPFPHWVQCMQVFPTGNFYTITMKEMMKI